MVTTIDTLTYSYLYIDLNDNMGRSIYKYSPTSTALGSQSQRTGIASVGAEGIVEGLGSSIQTTETSQAT